jgi:DNA-binding XRE family transcriptional regulator
MRTPLESEQRNTRIKRRGERFAAHPNPLKEIRLAYGYSQKEVAEKIQVTRQIVVDSEVGLSMHPNPKLVAYLANYEPALRTAISDAWYAWRADRRRDMNDPEGPRCLVVALSDPAGLPDTFSALVTSTAQRSGLSIDANYDSHGIRTFSRALIIQTSIVRSYIDRGHHWAQIELALNDIGLSPTLIHMIKTLPRTEAQRRMNEASPNSFKEGKTFNG